MWHGTEWRAKQLINPRPQRADGPLKPSFGLSGAVTRRRGQEVNNKRMKRRPWARPHPRAHSIPCQAHFRSKKSANPLRGFSLQASYVHICLPNNILFAICLAGSPRPAHSRSVTRVPRPSSAWAGIFRQLARPLSSANQVASFGHGKCPVLILS